MMLQRKVSVSVNDGGVGMVNRAEAVRNGHDAMSFEVVLTIEIPRT